MRFRILGPVEIIGFDRTVPVRGAHQRTLLGMLLTNAASTVTKDQIREELWSEKAPTNMDNALHAAVTRLRRILKESLGEEGAANRLITRPTGYCFDIDKCDVDAHLFENLVDMARTRMRIDQTSALAMLDRALSLWKGSALQGTIDGPISRSTVLRLNERRLSALEDRLLLLSSQEINSSLISELKSVAQIHPWRERIVELLMVSLYRSGRQVEAVQVYKQVRTRLVEELGIEPSPLLQTRLRAILKGVPQ